MAKPCCPEGKRTGGRKSVNPATQLTIMSHFPNYVNTPPGGWRYVVPETGKTIGPFSNWKQLRDVLAGHYMSAGYDMPGDIFEKVEAQICNNFPEYCGEPPKGYVERFVA